MKEKKVFLTKGKVRGKSKKKINIIKISLTYITN